MLQDAAEPNQRRQADAAQLQVIDQLLEIDRPVGVFRRVNLDLSVVADREVALAPAGDFVQLGRVGSRPALTYIVRGPHPGDRMIHAHHDNEFSPKVTPLSLSSFRMTRL